MNASLSVAVSGPSYSRKSDPACHSITQLLAKACQSTQARYSLKAQLSLRRQEFQQSQQQQMKLGPRLRVN